MATATARLNEPIATQAAPRTAFFNGRLLSAEDLQREQALRAGGDALLAQLVGCGIAQGLGVDSEARADQPGRSLQIEAGLGVTPSGQIIALEAVAIDLSPAAADGVAGGGFANCVAAPSDAQAPGAGLYLLALTPDWQPLGRADTVLGEVGACNRSVEQPAVRVRLLPLPRPAGDYASASGADPGSPLRNRLATSLLAPQPPRRDQLTGWLPRQRVAHTLSADDLPLAVLQLDSQARVLFVDAASARRRLAPPPGGAGDALWARSGLVEMEAFGQQFAHQLLSLLRLQPQDMAQLRRRAATAFEILPPVAVLDLGDAPSQKTLRELVQLEPVELDLPRFVDMLEQGLRDRPVPTATARLALLRLRGSTRWLLRATPDDSGRKPPQQRAQPLGEFSSSRTAGLAARVLRSPEASADERTLAGSVLTQAHDRKAGRTGPFGGPPAAPVSAPLPAPAARTPTPTGRVRKPRPPK